MALLELTSPSGSDGRPGAGVDPVRVVIDLDAGCRLASIVVGDDERATELLAPTPGGTAADSTGWGSFPMAPWAGRLRHGRYASTHGDVWLRRNHRDDAARGGAPVRPVLPADPHGADDEPRAHSIHGTVFGRRWHLDDHETSSLRASCPLGAEGDPLALDWPLGGHCRQTVVLGERHVDVTIELDAGSAPFDAVVGWHPWFAKPDRLRFAPRAMYRRDAIGMPTGELVDPAPPPWDDCFVADGPVELDYDRPTASTVRISSDCDHWVVFDQPPHATCVEPQSGPPDAVNLATDRPDQGRFGTVRVEDGAPLRRWMTIAW